MDFFSEIAGLVLIFQKRFSDTVSSYYKLYMASTTCTRLFYSTNKAKTNNFQKLKNRPLEPSYVVSLEDIYNVYLSKESIMIKKKLDIWKLLAFNFYVSCCKG